MPTNHFIVQARFTVLWLVLAKWEVKLQRYARIGACLIHFLPGCVPSMPWPFQPFYSHSCKGLFAPVWAVLLIKELASPKVFLYFYWQGSHSREHVLDITQMHFFHCNCPVHLVICLWRGLPLPWILPWRKHSPYIWTTSCLSNQSALSSPWYFPGWPPGEEEEENRPCQEKNAVQQEICECGCNLRSQEGTQF